MNKLTIFILLAIGICMPALAQDSKEKKEGLRKIGGNNFDNSISIIVNEAVLETLEGLGNLEALYGLTNLSQLSGLSSLSQLSELSKLSVLNDLEDLDFDFDFDQDDFSFDFNFDHYYDHDINIDIDDLDVNVREIVDEVMEKARKTIKGTSKNSIRVTEEI